MASIERLQRMSDKHAASRESILLQLIKLLFGLWADFDKWDDADLVAGMAARSATLVESASGQARILNRSYITTTLRELGTEARDVPAVLNTYPRSNATGSEVYRRPVDEFIWRRRNGGTLEESREAFEQRLREVAEADMRAAEREEVENVLTRALEVIGYRRIIHPELSKSGSCGLCIVASAQLYRTDELMPLHGGSCNCGVMAVTKTDDPGLRINDDDLKSIYAAAGSTAADDLVNTRIKINDHGELGPVLVKQGDHFRTAKEAGRPEYVKPTNASRRANAQREIRQLTEQAATAQAAYDEMPDGIKFDADGNTTPASIALFRSIRFMRERITTYERLLTQLAE